MLEGVRFESLLTTRRRGRAIPIGADRSAAKVRARSGGASVDRGVAGGANSVVPLPPSSRRRRSNTVFLPRPSTRRGRRSPLLREKTGVRSDRDCARRSGCAGATRLPRSEQPGEPRSRRRWCMHTRRRRGGPDLSRAMFDSLAVLRAPEEDEPDRYRGARRHLGGDGDDSRQRRRVRTRGASPPASALESNPGVGRKSRERSSPSARETSRRTNAPTTMPRVGGATDELQRLVQMRPRRRSRDRVLRIRRWTRCELPHRRSGVRARPPGCRRRAGPTIAGVRRLDGSARIRVRRVRCVRASSRLVPAGAGSVSGVRRLVPLVWHHRSARRREIVDIPPEVVPTPSRARRRDGSPPVRGSLRGFESPGRGVPRPAGRAPRGPCWHARGIGTIERERHEAAWDRSVEVETQRRTYREASERWTPPTGRRRVPPDGEVRRHVGICIQRCARSHGLPVGLVEDRGSNVSRKHPLVEGIVQPLLQEVGFTTVVVEHSSETPHSNRGSPPPIEPIPHSNRGSKPSSGGSSPPEPRVKGHSRWGDCLRSEGAVSNIEGRLPSIRGFSSND